MNTYMSVSITCYAQNPELNHGYVYISVESCGLESCHRVSYASAQAELLRLAKKLGKAPEIKSNFCDPTISYREVCGYLD